MRKELQKYISFSLCLLFLFPMVEKQIHAFEHSDDKHCTANEKHFHEQEHHCNICDFTHTDSSPDFVVNHGFVAFSQQFIFPSLPESVCLTETYYNLPSRAPPTAS